MTDFRFGILLWSQVGTWPEMLDAARRVDRLGYDSLWTWDHLHAIMGGPLQPIYEGYVLLGAWAAATERTKLGLLVGANTFRNPGIVTKAITTLDHASGGRAILGIGGAWFEYEHRAHGIQFGTGFGQRLDWLDEATGGMRALLDGGVVTSPAGGRYAFAALEQHPLPLQSHLPIMIGGGGEKKTLRTVAKFADYWNVSGAPDLLTRKSGILAEHCAAVGRDPASISRSTTSWIVVRDTKAEAERVWAEAMTRNGGGPRDDNTYRIFLGPPAYVAERLRANVTVGFESTIVELPAPYDAETIERLIGEVKPLVDRG